MTVSDHKSAMLTAIIADPQDMAARMAYADLLADGCEEEQARSGFIQTQMAMADIASEECVPCKDRRKGVNVTHSRCSCSYRFNALRHTERGWLDQWGRKWMYDVHNSLCSPYSTGTDKIAAFFRRGFVEGVQVAWHSWIRHGDGIRSMTPLMQVRLTSPPAMWEVEQGDGMLYCFRGSGKHIFTYNKSHTERLKVIDSLLKAEWPSVTFILPKN